MWFETLDRVMTANSHVSFSLNMQNDLGILIQKVVWIYEYLIKRTISSTLY